MGNMQACQTASSNLYDELQRRADLTGRIRFFPRNEESHCFRVTLNVRGFPQVRGLSISYPPDAMGNRGDQYNEGFPSTIETALIGETAQLYYNASLGYEDICRFSSTDELVDEILRLTAADFTADEDRARMSLRT